MTICVCTYLPTSKSMRTCVFANVPLPVVAVDCSQSASCTPERPCLEQRGSRCTVLTGGQCPRATKQCTKFSSERVGYKPAPWPVGRLGLTAQQACCACGGGAVDACALALDLEKLSSPYTTAIPESIRPRGLACGDGARVQVFKYKLKAGSTITIGPASRTKMAHALYMDGDCPGTKALECSTTRPGPMTYYNDGDEAVTLYYHVIDQHAWIHQTTAIGWEVKGSQNSLCFLFHVILHLFVSSHNSRGAKAYLRERPGLGKTEITLPR